MFILRPTTSWETEHSCGKHCDGWSLEKPIRLGFKSAVTSLFSVFSARNDMDQTRFPNEFDRVTKALYDQYLVPWKQLYGFVGTDYINIGNNPAAGEYTNWTVSRPMYQKYMGKKRHCDHLSLLPVPLLISHKLFLMILDRTWRRNCITYVHASIFYL